MNDKKYIKVVYESDPIGKEGIRLILTTFDIEAFKRDEALSKIPEKRIATKIDIPKFMYNDIGQPFDAMNNHNFEMLEAMIEKFVVDTYDKQIQEMKAYIEFLRDTKIVPVEYTKEEYYTVKKGDTLCDIAKKYKTTWQYLAKINGIKNPDLIYPKLRIKIRD